VDGFAGNYSHESGSLHQPIGELVRLQGRKRERIGEYFFFQFTSLLDDIIIEGCHLISYVFFDVHELGVNVCKYIKVIHRYRSSLYEGVAFSGFQDEQLGVFRTKQSVPTQRLFFGLRQGECDVFRRKTVDRW